MKLNYLSSLLILAILASGTVGVIGISIVHAENAPASGEAPEDGGLSET
jgi:hypothetical protein